MGGRSREPPGQKSPGDYGWLSELSDDRLIAYGRYSSAAEQNNELGGMTEHGIPKHQSRLNERAADEFKKRTGQTPSWDLRSNDGELHRQATLQRQHDSYQAKHGAPQYRGNKDK